MSDGEFELLLANFPSTADPSTIPGPSSSEAGPSSAGQQTTEASEAQAPVPTAATAADSMDLDLPLAAAAPAAPEKIPDPLSPASEKVEKEDEAEVDELASKEENSEEQQGMAMEPPV